MSTTVTEAQLRGLPCDVEPEILDEAKNLIETVIQRRLPFQGSVLATIIMGVLRRVYTTAVPTMAVHLRNDGFPGLLINPNFALDIGENGCIFVLTHEAGHIIRQHIFGGEAFRDDDFWNLAKEACINNMVCKILDREMPETTGERTGHKPGVTGVDPDKVYASYRRNLKKQGKTPVDASKLYATDLGCFVQLSQMTQPPRITTPQFCMHGDDAQDGDGDGDAQDGESGGQGEGTPQLGGGMDPEAVDQLAEQALRIALRQATLESQTAKKELIELMEASGGSESASKIWGDLGAGVLRGETLATRRTSVWEQFARDFVGTLVKSGFKLIYNRKLPWDRRVAFRGKTTKKRVLIAVDSSGSMSAEVLKKVAAMVGEHENLETVWLWFDGAVGPFVPGEPIRGGGGTNAALIDRYIEAKVEGDTQAVNNLLGDDAVDDGEQWDDDPDGVIVVTDGYFEHFRPRLSETWLWLITEGGDNWPEHCSGDHHGGGCSIIPGAGQMLSQMVDLETGS